MSKLWEILRRRKTWAFIAAVLAALAGCARLVYTGPNGGSLVVEPAAPPADQSHSADAK
jgi:hypothetical protein